MINKVFAFFFFFELCLALVLGVSGVTHVEMGDQSLAFLQNCNNELNDFQWQIPNIPSVSKLGGSEWYEILFDTTIGFLNALTDTINVLIQFLNLFISLFQFIYIVLKNIINSKNMLVHDYGSSQQIALALMSC